jgi:hypothetical protein
VVTQRNDGTSISYDELVEMDGHVNTHVSPTDATVTAEADIGGNVLTGNKASYALAGSGISSGTVLFEERVNGFTLATLSVVGSLSSDSPAHIHSGATPGGGILFTFKPISHTSKTSVTDLRALDDATPISFSELMLFDGSVNMHMGSTVIGAGNIGKNAFADGTTTPIGVTLAAVGGSGVSGTATVHSLPGGAAIVEIALTGTTAGDVYPVEMFDNASTPALELELSPVTGASGSAKSGSAPQEFMDMSAADFAGLTSRTGHTIRVLASPTDATVIAQGALP